MSRLFKWLLIALAVIGVVAAILAARFLIHAGYFAEIVAVRPQSCRVVNSPPGIRDIEVVESLGIAILSSADRRAAAEADSGVGALFAISLDNPDERPRLVSGAGTRTPAIFRPGGLSLYTAPDGHMTLMSINHRGGGHSLDAREHAVEVYDVYIVDTAMSLQHRRTVNLPDFRAPSDLVAVSADGFYFVNKFGSDTETGRFMEMYLGLKRSSVFYFDGTHAHLVVDNLGVVNGIDTSPDGKIVYVTELGAHRLKAFARGDDNTLTLLSDTDFGVALDHVNVADDGALWIGAHPNMVALQGNSVDPASRSPSKIIRVEPQPGGASRTLYEGDGEEISAAGVVAAFNGKFLAGAAYDSTMLVCDWQPPGPDSQTSTP